MNQKTAADSSKWHFVLLTAWVLVNLLQAMFTELADDEAYYWVYSTRLDWGYFHQPPFIGFLIRCGTFLSEAEWGVRLLPVLLNGLALHLVWRMTNQQRPFVFWGIIAATFLAHFAGFLAVPDSPFVFFTALFLYVTKAYLKSFSWKLAIVLGIVGACLLYSKYHGILVLGFVLLANWRELKRPSIYLIPLTIAVLMLPHLFWQMEHGFPGLGYHLTERFGQYFELENTSNYLLGQLLVTGPFMGILSVVAAIRYKAADPFERTLKVLLYGVMGYFFLWSFKGPIEANWTACAFLPLFVLAHNYLSASASRRKWVLAVATPSIIFLLLLRINIVTATVVPEPLARKFGEFNGWQEMADTVNAQTGDLPLLVNSYQTAAKLAYYTKKPVTSLNLYMSGNEYDLWNMDSAFTNQPVAVLASTFGHPIEYTTIVSPRLDSMQLSLYNKFHNYKKVNFEPKLPTELIAGSLQEVEVTITNPTPLTIQYKNGLPERTRLSYHWEQGGEVVHWEGDKTNIEPIPPGTSNQQMTLMAPDTPGEYVLHVCLLTANFGWWDNANRTPVTVVSK